MPKEIKTDAEFLALFQDGIKKDDVKAKSIKKDPKKDAKKDPKKQDKDAKEAAPKHQPKSIFKKRLIVRKKGKLTKFKLRTGKTLFTFKTENEAIIKTVMGAVPSTIERQEAKKKKEIKKKK